MKCVSQIFLDKNYTNVVDDGGGLIAVPGCSRTTCARQYRNAPVFDMDTGCNSLTTALYDFFVCAQCCLISFLVIKLRNPVGSPAHLLHTCTNLRQRQPHSLQCVVVGELSRRCKSETVFTILLVMFILVHVTFKNPHIST